MILHLSVTLLFYGVHAGQLVHAPGKAIPLLITYLSKLIPKEISQRLIEMQSNERKGNECENRIECPISL